MSKVYSEGRDLQERILSGVNKLADNVVSTLGPRGRNVIIHRKDKTPIITKDGVTVAEFVNFDDPFENVGAEIIKQVALETNTLAGDGTTTSTVLARAILQNAQKHIVAGASPVEVKRGIEKALKRIVLNIKALSSMIETQDSIEHVATVSSNGDKVIGELVAMAVDKAGHNGSVSIEEAKSMDTSLNLVEGFSFQSGYFSSSFVNNERKHAVEYDDPLLFVTDIKIDNVQEILPVLELAAREARPLVFIAEEVEGQALAAMIMNAVRGSMKVAAVKAPGYGQERRGTLKDICVSTGANFFTRESAKKMKDVTLSDFGQAKKIEVLKNQTTIVGGHGDPDEVDKVIEALKQEIKQTDDIRECEMLQSRVTRLNSGVVEILVGGATEVEMIEKKHRIEDALEAVKSALEEGIVAGGGSALLRCGTLNLDEFEDDQLIGARILLKSLEAPARQMAKNAGESEDLIINEILSSEENHGWNFAQSKMVNMIDVGIIDPAKVTRVALENAVSAASTLLTSGHAIVEK